MGAIAFSVFNYKSCLTGESACWFATFKFRVRLTMSFIITRLAVSLLDSTFPDAFTSFSACFLFFVCVCFLFFFFIFIGGTHTTYAFGIPKKLLLVWSVCVSMLWVSARHVSYVWRHTHMHTYVTNKNNLSFSLSSEA